MIRRAIYKNGPIAPEGETEDGLTLYHLDHCIDSLRQSAMCAGDITPIPFAWYQDYQAYESYSGIMRTCRDFGAIQDCRSLFQLMYTTQQLAGRNPLVVVRRHAEITNFEDATFVNVSGI